MTIPWRRVATSAGTIIIAGVCLGISRRLQITNPWLSGTLANICAALVLVVPLWWFTRHLDARIEHAETTADHALTAAADAHSEVDMLEEAIERRLTPLEELRSELNEEQMNNTRAEVDVYKRWGREASRDSLIAVLTHGTGSGLISARGLRAPIWETHLHFHYRLDDLGQPAVAIVTDDGTIRFDTRWPADLPPIDLHRQLDSAMENLGEHLGTYLFDPTQSIETAAEALAFAAGQRAQKRMNGSDRLERILEFVDGWYITEDGLCCRDHGYYFVKASRLDEMDWEQHISDKGWEGIHSALHIARAIHGVT